MTNKEKLELLLMWEVHVDDLSHQWERLESITGILSDSAFGNAVWRMQDDYTKTVARLLECDPEELSWYCFDNQMGKQGLECEIDGETREIRTLADLAWMLGLDG
jgi:hypothetical protein